MELAVVFHLAPCGRGAGQAKDLPHKMRTTLLVSQNVSPLGHPLDSLELTTSGVACPIISTYRRNMGQQHRVRAKRKRRRAYLERKKASLKSARRETSKPKPKKQAAAAAAAAE